MSSVEFQVAAALACSVLTCTSASCSLRIQPRPSTPHTQSSAVTERPKAINIPFLATVAPDFVQYGAINTVYIYNFHLPFKAVSGPIRAQMPKEFTFHGGSDSALYQRYPLNGPIRNVSLMVTPTKLDAGGVGIEGMEYKWTAVTILESRSRPRDRGSIPIK